MPHIFTGNERPRGGRPEPALDFLGPQTQGRHAALKIQVSQLMNYGNGARDRVLDPLDVCLRV